MNWKKFICWYGEIIGFVGSGYLLALDYLLLPILTLLASFYLAYVTGNAIKEEAIECLGL